MGAALVNGPGGRCLKTHVKTATGLGLTGCCSVNADFEVGRLDHAAAEQETCVECQIPWAREDTEKVIVNMAN